MSDVADILGISVPKEPTRLEDIISPKKPVPKVKKAKKPGKYPCLLSK
jgi:hypothetical protein